MSTMISKVQALQQLERQATHDWKHRRDGTSNNVRSKIITCHATFESAYVHDATCDSACDDAELAVAMRNALPGILAVLSQFREGDEQAIARQIKYMKHEIKHWSSPFDIADAKNDIRVLQRLQAACASMETDQQ